MNWKYKANIKQYLSNNDSDEEVLRIRDLIARELRMAKPFRDSKDDSYGAELVDDLRHCETAEELNDVLELIYDHAESNSVWLGI